MLTRVLADGPPGVWHPHVFSLSLFSLCFGGHVVVAEVQCSPGAVMHVSAQAALLSMYCIAMFSSRACMLVCVSISCAFRAAPCSLYALYMLHVDLLVCSQVPLLTEEVKRRNT